MLYKLKAFIIGNFFLVDVSRLEPKLSFHPSVRKIEIVPEFILGNKQTGRFGISIMFEIDDSKQNNKSEYNSPGIVGIEILERLIYILSFITNSDVELCDSPIVERKLDNDMIEFHIPGEKLYFHNPVPLIDTTLLSIDIDNKFLSALSWLNNSISAENLIDKFSSVMIAVETIVVNHRARLINEYSKEQNVKASDLKKRPSINFLFKYFLVKYGGMTHQDSKEIWKARCKLTHGSISRATATTREFNKLFWIAYASMISAFKSLIGLGFNNLPLIPKPEIITSDEFLVLLVERKEKEDTRKENIEKIINSNNISNYKIEDIEIDYKKNQTRIVIQKNGKRKNIIFKDVETIAINEKGRDGKTRDATIHHWRIVNKSMITKPLLNDKYDIGIFLGTQKKENVHIEILCKQLEVTNIS